MKHLFLGAAALALLSGCNEAQTPAAPEEVALAEVSVRTGNPAMAGNALAAMSLTETDSGVVAFAGKTVDGASATFTDVSIAGEDGLKAGSLVFEGLDMVDGKATFGKMSLNNISVADEEMQDGEVAIGNIELVNPSAELATWLAGTLNGQELPFPAAENVKFDSWAMNDMAVNFTEDGSDGSFGINNIEIRDMGGLKAAKATLSGLSLDVIDGDNGTPVTMSLADISISNIDTKFLQALQDSAGDEEEMLAAVMDVVYENPMDPGFDAFSMTDLSFAAAGASFAMPSLVSSVERNAAGQPVKYVTQPFTMTVDADADGGEAGAALMQGLSMVGYESLTLKGESVASYDPDKDILSYDAKTNYFELIDGAKLSFGGKIEGYSAYNKDIGQSFNFADLAEGEEPDPEAMMAAMGKLTLHNFEFSIDDNSLLDRAFNAIATAQGQDPEEMKGQISMALAMAPMMAQGSGIDMALVTEASGAVGKFIADGGELTFKLAPETPLSVAAIMENPDPAAYTKDALGFSATQK